MATHAQPPTPRSIEHPRQRPAHRRRAGHDAFATIPAGDRIPARALEDATPTRAAVGRDRLNRRLLACADVVAATCGVLVASFADAAEPRALALLAIPLVVVASKVQGLYDRDELLVRKTTMDEAPQLFHLATLYVLMLWLVDGVVLSSTLGPSVVIAMWASFFVFALVARAAARALTRQLTEDERCLFVGDAAAFSRLQDRLTGQDTSAVLVGRMSLQRVARRGQRVSDAGELRDLIAWTEADRVIIDPQSLPQEDMLDFVRAAKSVGVRVSLLPRVLDVVGTAVVFDNLGGLTLMSVRRFGLTRSSRLVKRAVDLTGAVAGLVAIAPLMAVLALAIRVDSRGPIFFRQTRVGRDGRHFQIFKFRTMCVDAEAQKAALREQNEARGGLFKIADDPRITRVGRLLRKTSLDELPQLFNVVTGDMSLVGPRPLVVDEDALVTGWDRRRLHLTPGMTGPWQILGAKRVPLAEMVKIDYLYVASWSVWADLKILLRTVPHVLARKGL